MAIPIPDPRPDRLSVGDFNLIEPALRETVPLVDEAAFTKRVFVQIEDIDGHDSFSAAIYNISDGSPPTIGTCVPLTQVGTTATWEGDIAVNFLDRFDILEDHKQVVVYSKKNGVGGGYRINPFRVTRTSATFNSGTNASQQICGNCSMPVPARLELNHGGGIANGTCLNCNALNTVPVILYHSNDPSLCCCWFSPPIAFCGANAGYWKLQKVSSQNWELSFLQTQPAAVPLVAAIYRLTTMVNDCQFPITLTRDDGSISGACTGWPNTITLSNFSKCLDFNGMNQYVSGSDASLPSGNSVRTISLWAKTAAIGGHNYAFSYGEMGTFGGGMLIGQYDGKWVASTNNAAILGPAGSVTTSWQHILYRRLTSGVSEIWVNGARIVADNLNVNTQLSSLAIGRFTDGSATSFHYPGRIMDVRVYNTALSDGDIAKIYNGGVPDFNDGTGAKVGWWKINDAFTSSTVADSSGNAHDGTRQNNPTWTSDGP